MSAVAPRLLEIPRLGEGLFEVRIVSLLKQPGDRVGEDEPIYVLESDKATLSIESPCAGILSSWRVEAGDVVRIGAPVAEILPEATASQAPDVVSDPTPAGIGPKTSKGRAGQPEHFVPPRTRAHARRLGVSAEELQAMARPGRRLTPEDVDRHLASRAVHPSPDRARPDPTPEAGTRRLTDRERSFIHRMRRSAEQVIPCTLTSRIRVDGLERFAAEVLRRQGLDPESRFVSAFQIVAHAVAQVVQGMPRFRSRLVGDEACQEGDHLDLGIAVHTPDDALVTAVIPGADEMDLIGFLDIYRRRVEEAMAGHDQVGPGTQVLLSNLGESRVTGGSPLLVAPAVAVLAYGEAPRLESDRAARWATLSMTFDHRLIQGVHATRFLEALQDRVEEFRRSAVVGSVEASCTAPSMVRGGRPSDAAIHRVLTVAAGLMGFPADRLDPGRSLATQGLDSLGAVALAERLGAIAGVALPATWVWRHPNVVAMAAALGEARPGWDSGSLPEGDGSSCPTVVVERTPVVPKSRSGDHLSGDPIAIVGVAFRFPGGIEDLDSLWDLLVRGGSAIGPVPSDRFVGEPDRDWTAGFLDGIDRFDASFFQISPHEAERMDPQHRLFLETVWRVLEDAGEIPADLAGSRTGVFAAVSNQDYHGLHRDHRVRDAHGAIGVAPSLLSNRVSHLLDLRGPSQTVDTACSGSLVALHAAVSSIRSRECDQALVGGANLFATPDLFRSFADAGMLASDGRNRTFDAEATGYVRGEGVAAILIKPLSAALRNGNPIHAVIRGSAVNHGGRSASLTAPNPEAQSDLLREAWRSAGITPSDLGCIEAHGTGTPLGDPIEVEALTAAWRSSVGPGVGVREASCVLGSVKPNLGHLEAVAGLAGVIKMIACLRSSMLPPSAGLGTINPHLPLAGGPFRLLREPLPWRTDGGGGARTLPRRVGVSSFGFGGANAHIVLEEAPTRDAGPPSAPGCVMLSARDPAALRRVVERLVGHLRRHPDVPMELVVETLRNGRTAWRFRLACLGGSIPEVVGRLEAHLRGEPVPGVFVGDASVDFRHPASSGASGTDVEALVRDWVRGGEPRGDHGSGMPRPLRIPLPGYPFAGERHWIGGVIPDVSERSPAAESLPDAGRLLAFVPEWQPVELAGSMESGPAAERWWVVGGGLDDLEAVRAVHPAVSWMPDAGSMSPEGLDVENVLVLPPHGGVGTPGRAVWSAFQTVRALLQSGHGSRPLRWISVTRGAEPWHWGEPVRIEDAGVHGFAGTLARECPDWNVTTVDLAPGDPLPFSELCGLPRDLAGHPWLRRRGTWHRRRLVSVGPRPDPVPPFPEGGVHVIIGGSGGLGQLWTRHLVRTTRARVVWIGRRPEDDGIRAALDAVAVLGRRPEYHPVDVADGVSLRRIFGDIRGRLGPIDSVVHAAVAGMDQGLGRMEDEVFLASFRAKAVGSQVLAEVLRDEPPGVLVFFSSMAAVTTDHGKAAYAAATGLQDALAADLAGTIGCPVRVVDWGYWGEVGIGREIPQSVKNRLHQAGFRPIPETEAWAAVESMIVEGPPRQVLVGAVPAIDLQGTVPEGVAWRSVGSRTRLRSDPAVISLPSRPDTEAHRELVGCLEAHLIGLLRIRLEVAGMVGPEWIGVAEVGRRIRGPGHLHQWLGKALSDLEAHGYLERDRDRIRLGRGVDGTGPELWLERRARLLSDPRTAGWMRLAEIALGGLPEILSGRSPATEVLFAGAATEAVSRVYEGNPVADHFNEVLATWIVSRVAAAVGRDPSARFRILEIGAGTGATSRVLLRHLQPWSDRIIEYAFTDVSRAFLNLAERREAGSLSALRFKVLDITRDPRGQGFAEGTYDVVVASNVLHATADIRGTLRHAKVLLQSGGMLVLNEISGGSVAALMTFGLLEGWWLTRDPEVRIPGCPGLQPESWRRMLAAEGFSPVVFPDPASHGLGQQIVIGMSDGWVRQDKMVGAGAKTPGVVAVAVPVLQPEAVSSPRVPADVEVLRHGALSFLRGVLGETLKIPPHRIDPEEPLETYGIDSILVMQLTNRLRRDLPDIRSSLFFEVRNLRGLVDHCVAHAPDRLADLLGTRGVRSGAPEVSDSPSTTHEKVAAVAVSDSGAVPASGSGGSGVEPVAIIGMSGAFPMASDLDGFWDNLVAGRDCVGEIPPERWRVEGFHDPDRARAMREGKSYTKAGAFLDGFADFDPLFFGIPPVEALAMDPQERLFLEHSWRAMEDAGVTRETLAGRHGGRVGVFAGITSQGFAHHAPAFWSLEEPLHPVSPISSVANRVSYLFNLHGPSLPVDTMCSSSLTAVHLACDHLRRGEVDLAFAGGVHLNLHPSGHVALCAKGMLSPTGRCRSFGKGADGFVPGEGVGVVLLKPLSRALADGDPIHAVIRGSHVNHGGRTRGYTVPNPHAQRDLVQETLRRAGLEASDIGCVEAHGTGTELGDPIEVEALAKAFGPSVPGSRCALGSVKSNIGHLEAAAGIAGLLKLVLQLRHRTLVPTLHAAEANPEIRFDGTPFFLPRQTVPWEPSRPGSPRCAGVSSFGAGGANAHVLLEEAPEARRSSDVDEPCLILLSARTPKALRETVDRLLVIALRQSGGGDLRLRDVAHTLQVGREAMEERFGTVVSTWNELRGRLEGFIDGAEEGRGTVLPDRGTEAGTLRLLEEDEDLRAGVDTLLRKGRLHRLLALWLRGARIDWMRLPSGATGSPRRVSLPTYPFQRQRLWIPGERVPSAASAPSAPQAVVPLEAPPAELAFLARWQAMEEFGTLTPPAIDGTAWCIDLGGMAPSPDPLVDTLVHAGAGSVAAVAWQSSWNVDELDRVLPDPGSVRCVVVRVSPAEPSVGWGGDSAVWALFRLARWLRSRTGSGRTVDLFVVVADAQPRFEPGSSRPEAAAVLGLAGSLAQSDCGFRVRLVDASGRCLRGSEPSFWSRVLALLPSDRGEAVRWESGRFHRRVFLPMRPLPAPQRIPGGIRERGVYVIVGGAGSVGTAITRRLAGRYGAQVVWIGRSADTSEPVRRALGSVTGVGPRPLYVSADVRDLNSMRDAVGAIVARLGPIHGAIFSAVVSQGSGSVADTTEEGFRAVLETKTVGSRVFQETLGAVCIDFVCHFSSIQAFAFTSSRDSAAYAAGIAHGDAVVRHAATRPKPAVGCIHWGYWRTFAEGTDLAARVRGRFGLIEDDEGAAFFDWFVGQLRARTVSEVLAVHASAPVRQLMSASLPDAEARLCDRGRDTFLEASRVPREGAAGPGMESMQRTAEVFESVLVRWMAASLRRIPGFDARHPDRVPDAVLPRYHRWWAECVAGLSRSSPDAGSGDGGWGGERDRFVSDPTLSARVPLVEECLAALPDILVGRTSPTDLMFPGGSLARVEGVYRDNPIADHFNGEVAEVVRRLVQVWKTRGRGQTVRLLEIGGGTGGTTASILRLVGADGDDLNYRFTDLSKAFLLGIENRHGRDHPGLSTGILDISQPPEGQGLELGSFDIVVATNVLHATADIRSTVRHARSLLCRNGVLVLNEVTRKTWFQFLTFGLLEGWWLFKDPDLRVPGSPVLDSSAWLRVLREEGLRALPEVPTLDEVLGQHVFVAESDGWVVLNGAPSRVRESTSVAVLPRSEVGVPAAGPSSASDPDPIRRVEEEVTRVLCQTLRISEAEVRRDMAFADYGIDSILTGNLVDRLAMALGVRIGATVLFDHGTISRLARHLVEVHGPGLGRGVPSDSREPEVQAPRRDAIPVPEPLPPRLTGGDVVGRSLDIAVIGFSGQFPGASDPEAFWRNLSDGIESIAELPPHYLPSHLHSAGEKVRGRAYSNRGGILRDRDCFDPLFFRISPREAESMNPHQRLVLEEGWKALEDAAVDPRSLSGRPVGLFIGAEPSGYWHETLSGYSDAIVASRLSYHLNLTGPAFTVNTGCSSSAVALHLACRSLRDRETDLALAGGVFATMDPRLLVSMSQIEMLSRSGSCRTFDERADGTVLSEGVGMLVLKRLEDAVADGDPIHGVIVGTGVNQDGASNGITAPNGSAQEALIMGVYERHGISPEDVTYVEAHGTATPLGDPVEANALVRAFRRMGRTMGSVCRVGSVKANIGHTAAGAAAIGLIKLLLSLRHRRLPGLPGFGRLNPRIEFEGSPLAVCDQPVPWEPGRSGLRMASLNAFGHSGTNVHLVVREHRDCSAPASVPVAWKGHPVGPDNPVVVPLSARTPEALAESARRLADFVRRPPLGEPPRIEELAWTLQSGREGMECRVACVAGDIETLCSQLDRIAAGQEPVPTGLPVPNDLRSLVGRWVAREGVDWRSNYGGVLPARLHLPTYPFARDRYWMPAVATVPPGPPAGSGPRLVRIDVSHDDPLISGHVVGGRVLVPGALVLEWVRAAVAAHPYRPGAGEVPLVMKDIAWLRPIEVPPPGVAVLIELVLDPDALLFRVLSGGDVSANGSPRIHATGSLPRTGPSILASVPTASGPVRSTWTGAECLGRFVAAGLDYGPAFHRVDRIDLRSDVAEVVFRDAHPAVRHHGVLDPALLDAGWQGVLALAGDALSGGLPFAVDRVEIIAPMHAVRTATVRRSTGGGDGVFRFDVAWRDADGAVVVAMTGYTVRVPSSTVDPGLLVLSPGWQTAGLPHESVEVPDLRKVFAIGLPDPWSTELKSALAGVVIERVGLVDPVMPTGASGVVRRLVSMLRDGWRDLSERGGSVVVLVPGAGDAAVLSGLQGLVRTLELENPRLRCHLVECNPTVSAASVAGILLRGLEPVSGSGWWRITPEGLWRRSWHDVELPLGRQGWVPRDGGVYLITGGRGGIGRLWVRYLSGLGRRLTLVIAGRSPSGSDDDATPAGSIVRLLHRQADVSDREQVERLVAELVATEGRLDGIFHAAGVVRDAYLVRKEPESVEEVLGGKWQGAVHLDAATARLDLDVFVLFSSMAAVVGNAGQSDYAAANGFLDAFAWWRQERVARGERRGRTLSVNWPLWREGGMQVAEEVVDRLGAHMGLHPLGASVGIACLVAALGTSHPQLWAIAGDVGRLRASGLRHGRLPLETATPPRVPLAASTVSPSLSVDAVADLLRRRLALVLRVSPSRLGIDETWDAYGIDSILAMDLTTALEEVFGTLPRTLFFEHQTLRALAGYFLRCHADRLAAVPGGHSPAGSSAVVEVGSPPVPPPVIPPRPPQPAPSIPALDPGANDIAIIGIAGRYPKARDLEAFWKNLRDGIDCITEIPSDRWDHGLYYDEDRDAPGKTYSKWGGFIDGIAEFDPLYFNISPREAAILDPQERLFLQCAQEVAEDAGYTRAGFGLEAGGGSGREVGVFVGVMYEEYPLHGAEETLKGRPMALTGSPASIANRVSHFMDLRGPSLAVDTMCSSSLTAIHLACQSLLRGECRMAFAGGVNLSLHPNKYLMLGQGRFVSAKGRCESFGEGAEGYVPAEGVGAILMKPLARALADGDRIHAVIRGTAVSHGGRTHGYTVPNPNGQAHVIGRALDAAGIEARSIGYLEAHGTGTVLGDPIEIAGLAKAFSERTPEVGFCALGSVKSNIGHAESAAGIAALTKVVLQMRHRQIVPSLHARTLNPAIDFASTPFVVQQALSDWVVPPGMPRRAGISSFGAGGGNAHIVVEETPIPRVAPHSSGVAAFVVSARTVGQLRELAARLSVRLEDPQVEILDVAWTLQVGREAFEERLAFVAASREEARVVLDRFASGVDDLAGLFRGNARRQRESVEVLSGDEDMARTLSIWVSKGRIDRVLDLWTRGLEVDWRHLSCVRGGRRVGLPHYPFAAERCWFSDARPVPSADPVPTRPQETAQDWLGLDLRWEPPRGASGVPSGPFQGRVLLLAPPGESDLVELLRRRLPDAHVVSTALLQDEARLDPASAAGWEACVDLSGLVSVGVPPDGWIRWSQAMAESAARRGIRWITVTRGHHPSTGGPTSTAGAMQAAWCRLMSFEHPAIRSVHLDLDPRCTPAAVVEGVLDLLSGGHTATLHRLLPDGLQQAVFETMPLRTSSGSGASPLTSDEVLWVSGGTRGLGALCARHFVERHGVRSVVLTGRDPLPERSGWVRLRGGTDAVAERIRAVEALESAGARVRVLALPLEDVAAVREARRQVEADWGPVGGVLHAAGSSDVRHPAWIRKPPASIASVWSPKTTGLDVLLEVFRVRPPRFVVLFSSVSGVVPALGAGLADYAMANAYQDAVARAWQGDPRVLSIQWPLWGESGSAAGAPVPRAYLEAGFRTHSDREGLDLLDHLLREGRRGVVFPARVDPARWNPKTLLEARALPVHRSTASRLDDVRPNVTSGAVVPTGQDRKSAAMDWLRGVLSAELRLEGSRIEDDVPFADYGADSVLLAQVLRRIRERLGSEVDPSLLLERPTLASAAQWLSGHAAWDAGAAASGGPASPVATVPAEDRTRVSPPQVAESIPADGGSGDIAVVGLSCRMPGAADLGSFWELLRTGRRAIGRCPEGRWASGSDWSGGWMDEVGWFDPEAFLIREEDARVMDPQAFLLLEEAVRTVCNAGYRIEDLRRRKIGVYVGGRSRHVPDESLLARSRNPIRAAGPNYLAANVSQFLDWQGPSLVVDTACSSALVALQMAVQALQSGEIEAAWVAGVSVLDSDAGHRLFASRGILAQGGEFHVFDARAEGVVPAEGAGGIFLKTLGRARADGDRVHAVLRGIAVNNDGRTAGPATPNPEAQREVMRRALERSGIDPGQVHHIEVNGSGSEVTDLLELKAIESVYRPRGGDPCWLGSVKPNIGHPLAAEGIAALIKVILMVREGRIAPFLSGQQPPRHFSLEATPFVLPRVETDWPDPVRRAALNCFADGGTNVHLLVESDGFIGQSFPVRRSLPVPPWNRRPWISQGPTPPTQETISPVDLPDDDNANATGSIPATPPPQTWRFERPVSGSSRLNRWRRAR